MIKKDLYEEIIIRIDKEELARMLDLEPGYAVQNIDEKALPLCGRPDDKN